MSERSMRRRRPSSPELALAAPLPVNDDLLCEILLRLPPLPSSFPHASLVSKRWRRILSDPQFIRRFLEFHHRRAPLLGCFNIYVGWKEGYFVPTLDPPNRIPSARLSLPLSPVQGRRFLDCRHGLVLILREFPMGVTVLDPVTRDKRCVALPRELPGVCGALVSDDHAGRVPLESFKVVLLWTDDVLHDADPHAFAFLYDSKAAVWSNIMSTSISRAYLPLLKPGILVGKSLFWLLHYTRYGNGGILKFDFDSKNLTMIDAPSNVVLHNQSQILRMEDSTLGIAVVTGFNIQVWEKKPNSEGGAKWMLHKTINMGNLLSLVPEWGDSRIVVHGCDEDGDAIFVSSSDDLHVFMVQLNSLQFKSLFKIDNIDSTFYPFKSFFTTGKGIGIGDIGAEILNKT